MAANTDKHIILISGANTGIGYETVKALYASPTPYTILMGSRSLSKAASAIDTLKSEIPSSASEVVAIQLDIEDDASIDAAYKEVESKYGRLDTLVNNAGASFERPGAGGGDESAPQAPTAAEIRNNWDHTFSLNVTSTQVMTTRFAPLLIASSSPRLLFVTSGLSSLETCAGGRLSATLSKGSPAGWPKPREASQNAYRSSKVALNMLMLDWARVLKADGVKVFAISPGFLATGLGGNPDLLKRLGAGNPSLGGTFIRDVVEGKRDADAEKVITKDGVQPW
jgi:NAD(P)-dependent dehydrogenase (short-subunit alcohol dehydrogenase family)